MAEISNIELFQDFYQRPMIAEVVSKVYCDLEQTGRDPLTCDQALIRAYVTRELERERKTAEAGGLYVPHLREGDHPKTALEKTVAQHFRLQGSLENADEEQLIEKDVQTMFEEEEVRLLLEIPILKDWLDGKLKVCSKGRKKLIEIELFSPLLKLGYSPEKANEIIEAVNSVRFRAI